MHLKTKRCKEFQEKDSNIDNNLLEFKKLINKTKEQIRNNN